MKSQVRFAIIMAWREARASWHRFVFFFVCIAIGVGAIVGVGLFAANVEDAIFHDAKSLLGGDLEVSSRRFMSEDSREVLNALQAREIEISHVSELAAMVAVTNKNAEPSSLAPATQLVELKAVEPSYPLYGAIETRPESSLASLFTRQASNCEVIPCFGAIVQKSLLISLHVDIGDQIMIGQAHFSITGIIKKEPDRVASAFSLGPRVLISRQALEATELLQPGSRIRERYRLRVPPSQSLRPLLGELRGRLAKEGVRVVSFQDAQPRVRRFLDQLSTYLGLIGLTTLFIGGIGVASTIQGYLSQKMASIAILKTIGAETSFIIKTYLFQSLLMGGIGSILGVVLGMAFQTVMPALLGGLLPFSIDWTLSFTPVLKGLILGLLSTAVFTLWPLLTIRHVPPALVFRREIDRANPSGDSESYWHRLRNSIKGVVHDRIRLMTGGVMGVCLAGLAMWQANSIALGLFFIAAFLVALLFLLLAAKLLLYVLMLLPRSRTFTIRNAISNLRRPGNYTAGMTVAIGVGVMVIMSIVVIKTSLLDALSERMPAKAPSFFFIDIQPDQREMFEQTLQQWVDRGNYQLSPVVRSRLTALEGTRIDPAAHKGKRNGWYFTRDYVLTALADLPKDNTIVTGSWWDRDDASSPTLLASNPENPARLSIEEEAAKNLGLDLGSIVELDIQGVPLFAKIESTRKVDWGSFSTNFFMILFPGALDGAPMTYIATARVSPDNEIPLQEALVARVPNVTAINVGDVLENIANLLQQLSWAIQGMALLCIINGTIVMTAVLATTRYRRLYEAAILKALGSTRRMIAQSLALEFGLLGSVAGIIGILLACALSWGVLHFFLDLTWSVPIVPLVIACLLTILLTLIVGFFSTYRLLAHPPLTVLREE
ncbi:MAG: ABC transporter permease [Nitrospirales bacterium]|nr:MAG: ABC transporter permease [Nitrospirales bacterium]